MQYLKSKSLFLAFLFLIFSGQLAASKKTEPIRYYNISVSDTHKFVWFRVAKVGTRSIYQGLANNHVQFSIDAFEAPFNPKSYQDHFKFAFVRNPWARVVSCYIDKVATKNSRYYRACFDKDFDFFVDFINTLDLSVADAHIRLQTKLIPLNHIDFIGRIENFNEDFQHVMQVLGFEDTTIPYKHRTQHKHYSQFYNERTKEIIARKYKDDIETFGYQFESQ